MTDRVILISPHLDDAALSCGGGLTRLTRAGVPTTIVTVFTADQQPGLPLTPLARRSHASWGIGDQPFAARRAEDLAAIRILGAKAEYLGLMDAIYRRSPSGVALYSNPLAAPASDDIEQFVPQLVDALRRTIGPALPESRIFCPAGTGNHVDHILVREAVAQLVDPEMMVLYEEYPYSARPNSSTTATGGPGGWPTSTLTLTAEELETRIAAIGCYASQLRGLFPSEPERLREIASARLPVVGRWAVRPPDFAASRKRMAARVRRDTTAQGGERYRWPPQAKSPFPEA